MKWVVLRGVSGSGKSSFAQRAVLQYPDVLIISADAYMVDGNGDYCFNPSRLSECHLQCRKQALSLATDRSKPQPDMVILDNTNTSIAEMAFYVDLAQTVGDPVEVLTLMCDPVDAQRRNRHGTPIQVVLNQNRRLRQQSNMIPPWWRHRTLDTKTPPRAEEILGAHF